MNAIQTITIWGWRSGLSVDSMLTKSTGISVLKCLNINRISINRPLRYSLSSIFAKKHCVKFQQKLNDNFNRAERYNLL